MKEPASPRFAGLLAVDKPFGVTSHDVVLRVRRRLGARGAGHLGTLDPGASGLLLVAMGAATRAIPVWQGGEKTYEGRARFGLVTSSQDLDGEVVERRACDTLSEEAIRCESTRWVGETEQVPPMVSALKVQGERLHQLARRGVTVERAPRRIRVRSWEWLEFALPEATFRVRCSGGTYVRTLVHDLGLALGCGAALAGLRRTRSEPFGLERSVTLDDLDRLPVDEVLERGAFPLDQALEILPAVTLDEPAQDEVGRGGRPLVETGHAPVDGGPRSVVLRDRLGRALALGELHPSEEEGRARAYPQVVFPWAVRSGPRESAPAAGSEAVTARPEA
jgi:tRNA pseudouridine55 synthase